MLIVRVHVWGDKTGYAVWMEGRGIRTAAGVLKDHNKPPLNESKVAASCEILRALE